MRKALSFFIIMLSISLLLTGCFSDNEIEGELFKFKDSYIGDNSAVGNIIRNLPNSDYLDSIELTTDEEPYGLTVKYNEVDTEIDRGEMAIYNATFLFALIQNADWVTLIVDDQEYKLNKNKLQDFYEKDVSQFMSEKELDGFILGYLESEKNLKDFFDF